MGVLSMRLDDELDERLSREAKRERRSRSELVREALSSFLIERERQRFLGDLVRAAGVLDPDESRAIAAEALPLDNEALAMAEPKPVYRAAPNAAKGRRR